MRRDVRRLKIDYICQYPLCSIVAFSLISFSYSLSLSFPFPPYLLLSLFSVFNDCVSEIRQFICTITPHWTYVTFSRIIWRFSDFFAILLFIYFYISFCAV